MIEVLESRSYCSTVISPSVPNQVIVPSITYTLSGKLHYAEPKTGTHVNQEMYDLIGQVENTLDKWNKGNKTVKVSQSVLDTINKYYGTHYIEDDVAKDNLQIVEDYIGYLIAQYKIANGGHDPSTQEIIRMWAAKDPNGYNDPNTIAYWKEYLDLQKVYGYEGP